MQSAHDSPPPLQAEQRVRDALAGAGISVWEWHIDSNFLSDLDEGTAMLGYAPGEVAPTQDAWTALIHPDDRDANDAAYELHACGETEVYAHEYRIRARDGSWRWMAERGRIVERTADGRPLRMLGTQIDISERRHAEGAATELAERLRKIARHVPGVVFQFLRTADGAAHFPYVSQRCFELTGLAPALLSHDAASMLRQTERADRERVVSSILRSMKTLHPWHCEFRLYRPDGAVRWLRGSATPQAASDGAVLWHGYLEDVSGRRELEQARLARSTAEAASRAKTEFLSRMSHELRTPLNAVLGFAQLLQIDTAEPLSPNQQRRVTLVREAGEHLLQMIGDLLDLTSIEAGRLGLEPTEIELAPLLRECADMLRPQADLAGVSLAVEAATPSLWVRADRRRLKQVLANLLSNAVKYNRRGGWVRLAAERGTSELRLIVTDSGVGISEDGLSRLFEPFNRLAHRNSTIEGTGIGLAVSRGLVEAMGGRIEVSSKPGAGSTFSVMFPAV